eukprot:6685987-Pyramimonas_sp.AAC.2
MTLPLRKLLEDVRMRAYVGVEPCASCSTYVQTEIVLPWIRQQARRVAALSPRKQAAARATETKFTLFPRNILD